MLNRKLNKIKEVLSEKEFLLSNEFKNYLRQQAKIISGKYNLELKFSNNICTNGSTIELNPLHPHLKDLSIEEKILSILGSLVHELFHILYTDFDIFTKSLNEFKEEKGIYKTKVFKDIINIIEDSYIELKGTNYYTGTFRTAIFFSNKNSFRFFPDINEYLAKNSKLNTLLIASAMYIIVGNVKGEIKDKTLSDIFEKIKPLLDCGRIEENHSKRIKYCKDIFNLVEPFIKNKDKDEDKGKDKDKDKDENKDKGENKDKTKGKDENESENENNCSKNNINEKENRDEEENKEFEYPKTNDFGDKRPNRSMQIKIKENNSNEYNKNKSNKQDSITEEDVKKALKDLQIIKNKCEEKIYKKKLEKEKEKQLGKNVKELSKIETKGIHKNIELRTVKISNINCDLDYWNIFKPLTFVTNNLIKRMKNILASNTEEKLEGFYSGRLSKKRLYRRDNKIFTKKLQKKDKSNLVILILVDQSGSMGGNRIEYAKQACIVISEVCTKLDIPLSIIGHTALYEKDIVEHRHFIDFDSYKNQKFSLVTMETIQNTREGLSLLYAKQYISKRLEKDKIIISISDGAPYHLSRSDVYYDEYAAEDVKKQIEEIRKEKIKVIGLAIGDDSSTIENLYKPNFIDIPNLELLPIKLAKIIEKNLLK